MSSDFEGYEQDFAVLTAEITSKIARVPRLPPDRVSLCRPGWSVMVQSQLIATCLLAQGYSHLSLLSS
ncbi:Vesicle transport through interaction with t-SNAREs-like protein 1A [Plecturocebus cupreus]